MPKAIKIGETRVQLDNIAYVEERTSEWLFHADWDPGELREDFSKSANREHITGTVATIVYAATYGGEEGGLIQLIFYGAEADEFLAKYDKLTKVARDILPEFELGT